MPDNEFSEFTFGFAFTQEVTTLCWEALPGAPEMPSLFDEGNGKGYDVGLGLYGWTLFAQFKRGSRLTTTSAKQWGDYGKPYYRFEIRRGSESSQHDDLRALAASSHLHWVVYVSPAFHTNDELSDAFLNRTVLDRVRMVEARAIGELTPDEPHYVTYENDLDPVGVYSSRRTIRSISADQVRNRLRQRDLGPVPLASRQPDDQGRPFWLDAEYFETLASEMELIGAGREAAPQSRVLAQLGSLSPFGRVRVLGRMIFGGELIPLPVGIA